MDLERMPMEQRNAFRRLRKEHPNMDNDTLATVAEQTLAEQEMDAELWAAVNALSDN